MINPLQLGNRTFPTNLIQGPLAGISCAPFRALTWVHGNVAFSCTEMLSAKTVIHQPILAQQRYLQKSPAEGPVCFQLSGNNPEEIAKATKRLTDHGADLIDLNCGCPVKKIRQKGAGSSLLEKPDKLFKLITAMRTNTHLPISIKIRVEDRQGHQTLNQHIAKVINESGVDFLTVHGRHWTEHYETPCRYDAIKFFVENVSVPVIGNGDVANLESLKQMLNTGCAGVMIGRAGVGQPWLSKQLIHEYQAVGFTLPTPAQIVEMFLQHVGDLIKLLGNEKFAILQARTFAKYYARQIQHREAFTQSIQCSESLDEIKKACIKYFY